MSGKAIADLIAGSNNSDCVIDSTQKEADSPTLSEYSNFIPKWVFPYLAGLTSLASHTFEREGAVLSLDIVGFTRLTGLLGSSSSAEGGEKISNILNMFFGKMIALIEQYGGDTIQFSGDAIMAIFTQPTNDNNSQLCVNCATAILKAVENSEMQFMNHTIELSIKLGISYGTILHVITGGHKNKWMVLHSGEVWNHSCNACESCPAGHVLVHSSCQSHLTNTYGGTKTGDGSLLLSPPFSPAGDSPNLSEKCSIVLSKKQLVFYRGFVPKGIKRLRPETRMINTMFVKFCNLPTPTSGSASDLFTICEAVQTFTSQYGGSLNKVLFDDKGLLALICFGVTGHVHADDAMRSTALALELIRNQPAFKISIGITSGRVFCGVLGNDTRAEYTLLGNSVNLAARLMTHGATSQESSLVVDEATLRVVKSAYSFKTTTVSLKGISEPVTIAMCDTMSVVPADFKCNSAVNLQTCSSDASNGLLTVEQDPLIRGCAPSSKNLRTVAATNELWFKSNRKRSTIGGETVKLVRTGSQQLDSLVGRTTEITKLDELLCSMYKSSTFKVLAIKGNPGVGKTTFLLYCVHNFKHPCLLISFSQETRVLGGIETLLTCLAFKHTTNSPRKDDYATRQGEVCSSGWLNTLGADLQYLVNNLQSGVGLKPKTTEDVVRLLEAALTSHCKTLSTRGIAIMIDGIQWMDWTSLNLIQESVRRVTHKVVMVCSFTTGFGDAQTTVCSDLSGSTGRGGCKTQKWLDTQECEIVELGPMTKADAILHYRHYIQTPKVDTDLSDLIFTNSEGSPLLAEIIINHLIEQDLLGNSVGVTVLVDKDYNIGSYLAQLPQIIAIVTRQLDHIMLKLGESVSRFLKVLSLMEHLIDSRLVTRLFESEMTPEKSQKMCAQLIGSKVLKVTERQKLCFSSMLLPKVLQNNMLVSERREAHLHIATVMEQQQVSFHLEDAIIACHFHQADRRLKAKEWYERALDEAWSEQNFFEAHKLLNTLIDLQDSSIPQESTSKKQDFDNTSDSEAKYEITSSSHQDEWQHMLLDLNVVLGMKKSGLSLIQSWCKTSANELEQLGANERSLPWLTWVLSNKYTRVQSMPLKEFLPVIDLAVLLNNRDLYIGAVGAMEASKRRIECNSLALISIYNAALAFKLILLGKHNHAAIAWTKVDVYNKVSISTLLAMLAVKGHMYTKKFTPKILSTDARGTYRADSMMLLLRVVFAFLDGKSGCSASYADAAMHISRKTRDKSFFMTAMLLGRVVKLTFDSEADPNAPQVVTGSDNLLCLIKQPEWSESTDSIITFMSHAVTSCDPALDHPLREAIDHIPHHVMNPLIVPVLILLIDTIWLRGLTDEQKRISGLTYLDELSPFINKLRSVFDEWGDGLHLVLQYARCSLGGSCVPNTTEMKNIENNVRTKLPIMYVRMRVITTRENFTELVLNHVEDLS